MNPATAFGTVFVDELIRCGLREAVLAPGSRSAPLAMALFDRAAAGGSAGPRLHVRIDERSAAFLGLGLAKASRRPVALICTSGTAAAHFHAAVIEADEAGIPLIVLSADRPPELRGTGTSQTIDQLKLYGAAVRWFSEAGVPEERPGMVRYWRSLACHAWAMASGGAGGLPGPVHINLPLRDPLVPDGDDSWPESLDGRPDGAPWTSAGAQGAPPAASAGAGSPSTADVESSMYQRAGSMQPIGTSMRPGDGGVLAASMRPGDGGVSAASMRPGDGGVLAVDWTERGVVVCGDGDYDTAPLLDLAAAAGWPVLAEPSSGARSGPNALSAYGYLLDSPEFVAGHRPDLIVSAGRPGLSRGQLGFLRGAPGPAPARHVVVAQGPGRWADPARTATEVASGVELRGSGPIQASGWLAAWQRADAAARRAADEILDADELPTEPRVARDLAAAMRAGGLLWAGSSLPVRDLDQQMSPRAGLRVLASRGTSGIDGLISSAIGAALAHQADGGGPAVALLGDLAFVHDAAGLMLGAAEPTPDLCIVVVNNDGGGIFSTLEQAAFPESFERLFGTPHGTDLGLLTRAAGVPHLLLDKASGLPDALRGDGLRVVEVRTDRAAGATLRARLREACSAAAAGA
jgi:2-succinyl-5-enolpyruvyl-6-hydroxy-3-cyclohexene-1-carboxylate synthase